MIFGLLSGLGLIGLIVFALLFTAIEITLYQFDKYGWGTIVFGIGIVAAYFGFTEFHDYISNTAPLDIAYRVGEFIGLGIGVAFLKWLQFNHKFASALAEIKAGYENFDKNDVGQLNALFSNIKTSVGEDAILVRAGARNIAQKEVASFDELVDVLTPKAKKNIDRISAWIATWPFVIVHTLFAEFIIKFGKHVASFFDSVFGKVIRAIVANGLK